MHSPEPNLPPEKQEDLILLTVKQLRERAAAAGVSAQTIEDARDSADPQTELAALIIAANGGARP